MMAAVDFASLYDKYQGDPAALMQYLLASGVSRDRADQHLKKAGVRWQEAAVRSQFSAAKLANAATKASGGVKGPASVGIGGGLRATGTTGLAIAGAFAAIKAADLSLNPAKTAFEGVATAAEYATKNLVGGAEALKGIGASLNKYVKITSPATSIRFERASLQLDANLGRVFTPMLDGVSKAIGTFAQQIANASPVLIPVFRNLGEAIAQFVKEAGPMMLTMVKSIGEVVTGIIRFCEKIAKLANSLGLSPTLAKQSNAGIALGGTISGSSDTAQDKFWADALGAGVNLQAMQLEEQKKGNSILDALLAYWVGMAKNPTDLGGNHWRFFQTLGG
jgi:hypothetical protein